MRPAYLRRVAHTAGRTFEDGHLRNYSAAFNNCPKCFYCLLITNSTMRPRECRVVHSFVSRKKPTQRPIAGRGESSEEIRAGGSDSDLELCDLTAHGFH